MFINMVELYGIFWRIFQVLQGQFSQNLVLRVIAYNCKDSTLANTVKAYCDQLLKQTLSLLSRKQTWSLHGLCGG